MFYVKQWIQHGLLSVVILLTLLLNLITAYSTCNVRPDPFNQTTSGKALGITFYIDLNNPFTCYGIIKQWRLCYKSSPGAISDTINIGVYQADGNSYVKKGSNSISLQLQDKDCLYINADPELVVQEGYVVAFYATLVYIKFFDDEENGYLYKSVAFPKSISQGVLIKTTHPYAPKLQAYIETVSTTTTTSTSSTTTSNTLIVNTISSITIQSSPQSFSPTPFTTISPSPTPFPSSNSNSGIPPPDLEPNQCFLGVNEAFVSFFKQNSSLFLNHLQPAQCDGRLVRWEFCHKYIETLSQIRLGVWRPLIESESFLPIGENEIFIGPRNITHSKELLVCRVIDANITNPVRVGDLIGFITSEIFMAFADEKNNVVKGDVDETPEVGNAQTFPLLRGIIGKFL